MYQPFQRGGYEHGTPHESKIFSSIWEHLFEIMIISILAHSHHFHSTANQKFTRKPRVRGSPRPSHVVNGGKLCK